MATRWDFSAKIVPLVVGTIGITVTLLSLFNDMCRKPAAAVAESLADSVQHEVEQKIHMDLASDTQHLPISIIAKRGLRFFGYLVAFMGVMSVIGLVPTVGSVRHRLHAIRKPGALETRHQLRDRAGVRDQLRVRQRDVDPVAADIDRAVVPGAEVPAIDLAWLARPPWVGPALRQSNGQNRVQEECPMNINSGRFYAMRRHGRLGVHRVPASGLWWNASSGPITPSA